MGNIGERVKQIRKDAGLSMEAFGERIGINKSSTWSIENGKNNPSERTLKVICSEFRVNYLWLTTGEGPVYSDLPATLIDELAEEYALDELDQRIVRMYLALDPEKREVIKEYIRSVFLPENEKAESS